MVRAITLGRVFQAALFFTFFRRLASPEERQNVSKPQDSLEEK